MFLASTQEECAKMLCSSEQMPLFAGTQENEFTESTQYYWVNMMRTGEFFVPTIAHVYKMLTPEQRKLVIARAVLDIQECAEDKDGKNKLEGKTITEICTHKTYAKFFQSYAFLNYAFLKRGVSYTTVVDEKTGKEKIQLLTANIKLIEMLMQQGKLLKSDGTQVKSIEEINKIINKCKVLKPEDLKMGVACLKPVKQRGNTWFYYITGRQSHITLNINNNVYITSLDSTYSFVDLLKKNYGKHIFKFVKQTEHGEKTHVCTFNVDTLKTVYDIEHQPSEKVSLLKEAIERSECGFSIGNQYLSCYDLERPVNGGIMAKFHPTSLVSLENVDVSEVDTTLHTIDETSCKLYAFECISLAKANQLKVLYKDFIDPKKLQINKVITYKREVYFKLLGLDKNSLSIPNAESYTLKELWHFMLEFPVLFGDEATIKKGVQAIYEQRIPQYMKNFEKQEGTLTKESLLDLAKKHIIKVYYQNATEGKISTSYLTNNILALRQIYGTPTWMCTLSPLKRLEILKEALQKGLEETYIIKILDLETYFEQNTIDDIDNMIAERKEKIESQAKNETNSGNVTLYNMSRFASNRQQTINPKNIVAYALSELSQEVVDYMDLALADIQNYIGKIKQKKSVN